MYMASLNSIGTEANKQLSLLALMKKEILTYREAYELLM